MTYMYSIIIFSVALHHTFILLLLLLPLCITIYNTISCPTRCNGIFTLSVVMDKRRARARHVRSRSQRTHNIITVQYSLTRSSPPTREWLRFRGEKLGMSSAAGSENPPQMCARSLR